MAAQFVDYLFAIFLLMDVEHMRFLEGATKLVPFDLYDMPLSHSLLGTIIAALFFAVPVYVYHRKMRPAILAGVVVLTHWFIDLLVHGADLSLAGGAPKFGFGLWNAPAYAIVLELVLTGAAFFYYIRATRPPVRHAGHSRVYILAGVMLALQLFNWFGPEDSDVTMFAILMLVVFTGLAFLADWAGRGRRPVPFRRRRFH
ncbi:hypothetical protein [Novosphingopyxis sp. YJ-S2-01]|uniref:hypothetical protein n=1 Tax=Novosphingopyxis sp. YJ-S2-01 TaxID=2794021 RepID=UPI002FC2C338